MALASIVEVISNLEALGLQTQRYLVSKDMISTFVVDDLLQRIRELRFITFASHNAFCSKVHAVLKSELNIDIVPLYCSTSVELQEDPQEYALHFDCLTLDPLSTKHTLWLEFASGKCNGKRKSVTSI